MNIWTNGCYDIIHIGHMRLFEYASNLGNLHIGIDADNRVKQLKGYNRPFNTENIRKEFLYGIKYIKSVDIFNNEIELCDLLKKYCIDTIVIGDDYKNKHVIGQDIVSNIIFFPKISNISTSKILCHKNN
jgi:D-beta-D-heptose 7-phosphate kinase/D-beta-D-heptose 1-phosphate adenosyltransferase